MKKEYPKIQPTCKYGHGELAKINKNEEMYGYPQASNVSIFAGDLYVCMACGYTELFDNDIAQTLKDLER